MKKQPHNSSWRSKHRHWKRGQRQWFYARHGMTEGKLRSYDNRQWAMDTGRFEEYLEGLL